MALPESLPTNRPLRIYSDGIYDLFHYGHARALEQAKTSLPNVTLIVGVCSDATTKKYKGNTVLTQEERYESLRHCKWVDEIIPDAPWIITQEFMEKHQIDFVAHDAIPYATEEMDDVYAFVKAKGKFLETKRTSGVSTTDLISRIIKDYDLYVQRNLDRGVSGSSMNVSRLKRTELWLKDILRKTLFLSWNAYTLFKTERIPRFASDRIDSVERMVAPIIRATLEILFGVKVKEKI